MMGANNTKRCAVYTRKSTEDGLELKYNSLDAQYDACSAYIRSQIGMGWTLVDKRYDDGGYSGGNTKRPGLTELLADIEAGLVDAVVVYKIDRLSRSIMDFADLFKAFEKHHVSFVSVTQQIDTSNAAGRMMLNILMSFAQFEREMSADRVRDKIYQAKQKGMWVGGVIPYGYKTVDKQLVVEPVAAKAVEYAFKRYEELGSTLAVARELNAEHPRIDGIKWNSQNVLIVLRNIIYEGFIASKRTGETFKGVHEAIVSPEAFTRVQKALDETAGTRSSVERRSFVAALKGLLRCGTCGSAMTPAYSFYHGKKNRRYTYYRCSKSSRNEEGKCNPEVISGNVIEKFVFAQLEDILRRSDILAMIAEGDGERKGILLDELDDTGKFWDSLLVGERERIIHLLVKDVLLCHDKVELTLTIDGGAKRTIPCRICNDGGRTRIIEQGDEDEEKGEEEELGIAKMFRKSYAWLELLTSGTYASKKDLARALGLSGSWVAKRIRLQFFSPRIVEIIMNGSRPDISVEKLSHISTPIWEEQERELQI